MSSQGTPGSTGWFPDPTERFDSRYWDGSRWTDAVMRDGEVESDPAHVAPSQASPSPSPSPMPAGPPPTPTDRMTSLAPADAQTRVSQMLAMNGFVITSAVPGRLDATIEIKPEPNWIVVCVLLFLWIVPGVVYWYVKTRPETHRVTLYFVAEQIGTRVAIQAPEPVLERVAPALVPLPW